MIITRIINNQEVKIELTDTECAEFRRLDRIQDAKDMIERNFENFDKQRLDEILDDDKILENIPLFYEDKIAENTGVVEYEAIEHVL